MPAKLTLSSDLTNLVSAATYADAKSQLGITELETSKNQVTLSYSSTITTDISLGHTFDITLTGNVILANPTNGVDGQGVLWRIRQDGSGNRTITLGDKFKIPTGGTLTWSTSANKIDLMSAIYHSALDQWHIVPPSGY